MRSFISEMKMDNYEARMSPESVPYAMDMLRQSAFRSILKDLPSGGIGTALVSCQLTQSQEKFDCTLHRLQVNISPINDVLLSLLMLREFKKEAINQAQGDLTKVPAWASTYHAVERYLFPEFEEHLKGAKIQKTKEEELFCAFANKPSKQ